MAQDAAPPAPTGVCIDQLDADGHGRIRILHDTTRLVLAVTVTPGTDPAADLPHASAAADLIVGDRGDQVVIGLGVDRDGLDTLIGWLIAARDEWLAGVA